MSDISPAPENVVERLARRFGTQARLADAAGCSQPTISERKAVGTFTHRQMLSILRNAAAMGVEVSPADFFPADISQGGEAA